MHIRHEGHHLVLSHFMVILTLTFKKMIINIRFFVLKKGRDILILNTGQQNVSGIFFSFEIDKSKFGRYNTFGRSFRR